MGFFGAVLFYFMYPLWWDNYRQYLRHHLQDWRLRWTTKLLRLKLHCIWTWWLLFIFYFPFYFTFIYIYIFFFHLLILHFYSYLYSFILYFQSSLCLSNAFSAYGWLVHCLFLFISLKLFCLFLCFFFLSTWLFVFPFSFKFCAFHLLSPFHSKYH
jgi:hypothetical protein